MFFKGKKRILSLKVKKRPKCRVESNNATNITMLNTKFENLSPTVLLNLVEI